MKKVVLSLSGGMDSSSLLLHFLSKGYSVIAVSFDYGQKHILELSKAKELWAYLKEQNVLNDSEYHVIKLEGLNPLLNSSLTTDSFETPEGHYANENMKATVVPNRNKIFSSIIQGIALSCSSKYNIPVEIALGIHAGDHAIYPDCRQEFRDADYHAFVIGNWGSENVTVSTPYLHTNKTGILKDGIISCDILKINFNEVYKRTNTSYKPVLIGYNYYSDYKSASSVERIEAFIEIDRKDPVQYADETGLVPWEIAKKHVIGILAEQV